MFQDQFSYSVFRTLRGEGKVRSHLACPCLSLQSPTGTLYKLDMALHKCPRAEGGVFCREGRPAFLITNCGILGPWLCCCLKTQVQQLRSQRTSTQSLQKSPGGIAPLIACTKLCALSQHRINHAWCCTLGICNPSTEEVEGGRSEIKG